MVGCRHYLHTLMMGKNRSAANIRFRRYVTVAHVSAKDPHPFSPVIPEIDIWRAAKLMR
jgi:hypothetical protein